MNPKIENILLIGLGSGKIVNYFEFVFDNLNDVINFFRDIQNTINELNPNVSIDDILDQYEIQGLSIKEAFEFYTDLKLLFEWR